MANQHLQFHITFNKANLEHWPNGYWALYEIDGDEIARRVGFNGDGGVVHRDSWPGFIGGFGSMADVAKAIESIQRDGIYPPNR